MRILYAHISTGTSDNVLIYGVVRTLEEMITDVMLIHFGERLNFVTYWGATKNDIGSGAQRVRPNSPTVMLVTAAAATGINLNDVGLVIAFKVQNLCELQQIAGRANRDPTRDRIPVIVCVDEATLRLPTVSSALQKTLAALRRTRGCVIQQVLAGMVPPTVSTAAHCGGCTGCDTTFDNHKYSAKTSQENSRIHVRPGKGMCARDR